MTTQLALIETALQGLTMDVVINLTEHVQTLELKPNSELFTAYRIIDNTILIGYSEDLIKDKYSLNHRHFFISGQRRGTKREHRLLLRTLSEMGIKYSYNECYFLADNNLVQQLLNLNWPIGDLQTINAEASCEWLHE
jgi:hypothetical protein